MYRRADCVPRIKDLSDLGVLTDEAMTELSLYIQDTRNPIVRRVGLLNGHCTAVNVIWTGLVL